MFTNRTRIIIHNSLNRGKSNLPGYKPKNKNIIRIVKFLIRNITQEAIEDS